MFICASSLDWRHGNFCRGGDGADERRKREKKGAERLMRDYAVVTAYVYIRTLGGRDLFCSRMRNVGAKVGYRIIGMEKCF